MTVILTFRYRLLPSRRQHAFLAATLTEQRQLYNAGNIGFVVPTRREI
jgi:hypothetical protein